MRFNTNQINKALTVLERGKYNALQQLRDMDREAKIKKYVKVPHNYIPVTRFEDKTANGLTACIIHWLHLRGHYATRVTSMGRKLKDVTMVNVIGQAKVMHGKWIPGTTKKGTADIHGVIHGKHVSIEVKIGADRMSPEQHRTKQQIEESGGCYYVAKDFQAFYEWYNAAFK